MLKRTKPPPPDVRLENVPFSFQFRSTADPAGAGPIRLVVLPGLKDKNGHGAAVEYDLDLSALAPGAAS